jgi:hypothetical protein
MSILTERDQILPPSGKSGPARQFARDGGSSPSEVALAPADLAHHRGG